MLINLKVKGYAGNLVASLTLPFCIYNKTAPFPNPQTLWKKCFIFLRLWVQVQCS